MVEQYNKHMICREIEDEISPWLDTDKIIILKGARQVGKTTILGSLRTRIEASGQAVRYIAADLDFADPSFGDPRLFLLRLEDLFGARGGTVLIDEFQSIPAAGQFLKTIHDQGGKRFRFVVTGSSSLELARSTEFLTGRKREFLVRPFSFREYVRARAGDLPDGLLDLGDEASIRDRAALHGQRLRALYAEYLRYGGYPEPSLAPPEARLVLLRELLSTYIHKDVAGFQRVANVAGFNNLVRVLFAQVGSQVNRSELSSTLRLNQETVSRYLDILEGTYVIKLVPPLFSNPRKEVSKMPKAFVTDPGFALATGSAQPENSAYDLLDGHWVENRLWSVISGAFGQERVKYWRSVGGAEVDFVVETDSGILPLEVKFKGGTIKEPLAMRNFREAYPASLPGIIVSRDQVSVPGKPGEPFVIPAYLAEYLRWGIRA